uniref:RRM domain-containing protein n=1 Tax=Globodera pallida TaxID=36090 RepID=A0A183C234_GLOPA
MSRIYVGHIPYETREKDLERFFKGYGRIRDILIKRGYAFVELDDARDADDAVHDLNGRSIMGIGVMVRFAKGRPWRSGPSWVARRRRSRSGSRTRDRRRRSRLRDRRRSPKHSRSRSVASRSASPETKKARHSPSRSRSRTPDKKRLRSASPRRSRSITPRDRSARRRSDAKERRSRSPKDRHRRASRSPSADRGLAGEGGGSRSVSPRQDDSVAAARNDIKAEMGDGHSRSGSRSPFRNGADANAAAEMDTSNEANNDVKLKKEASRSRRFAWRVRRRRLFGEWCVGGLTE